MSTFTNDIKYTIIDYLSFQDFRTWKTCLRIPISYKISQVLSALKLSTITVGGALSNISYNEEKDINILRPKGKVLGVSSNFYEALLRKDGEVDEQLWQANKPYPPFPVEPKMYEDIKINLNDIASIDSYNIMINNKKKSTKANTDVASATDCKSANAPFAEQLKIAASRSVKTKIINESVMWKKAKKAEIYKPYNQVMMSDKKKEQERINVNKIRERYVYPCTIPKKKSNRGRKKQIKKEKKRKTQGSGKCFNSGSQFIIKGTNPDFPNKYYKIKVYRNGSFTIPGGLSEDLSDVMDPLITVADFFSTLEKKVEIEKKYIIMQNYKCNVQLDDVVFDIDGILNVIYAEKNRNDELNKIYGIRVGEITYPIEKHAGLTIKLWRQSKPDNVNAKIVNNVKKKRNKNEKTTVKISQKCKINIDGAIEKTEVVNIWRWLNDLILRCYNDVIIDTLEPFPDSDSDSDDTEYEDIFEDTYENIYENEDSDHDDYENWDYTVQTVETQIISTKIIHDSRTWKSKNEPALNTKLPCKSEIRKSGKVGKIIPLEINDTPVRKRKY